MTEQTNNKTIARNTVFLYFRMLFTMVVSLYTSRVILQVLGVDDYGIYQVVGGVVGMLAFLNGALSTGSSRFLTFELGAGHFEKLRRTFSTTLTIHVIIALIIILLAETVGLWFVYHKLVIPADRMEGALWAYHLSILTAAITITQVPYNASIISHEKMSVYAFMSIIEVLAKLGVVYLLGIGSIDKLKLYAILLCVLQVSIALFYRFYCISKFKETHYKFIIDKEILKSIASFSGWSLFANLSYALNTQGTAIITNIFFGPAVVTARAISIQVSMAASQFVNNFRMAVNPQIVKRYAMEDYNGSKKLLLESTKYSFYLMYLLGLPILLVAEPLLKFWLGIVPEYTVIFLQLIIVQSLFQVFDTSFYTALYAKGELKLNALISPTLGFIQFPIVYFLFKLGYSPVVLSWVSLVVVVLLGLVVKPMLACKVVNYTCKDIFSVFIPCLKVTIASLPLSILGYYLIDPFSIVGFLSIVFISILSVTVAVYLLGLNKDMRKKILTIIKSKVCFCNSSVTRN